jgi:F-type H+-transporting ATPase subunit b
MQFIISKGNPWGIFLRVPLKKDFFMDSIINTFHIDWKIMIAQVLNFGVVFVVLYLFALKPLVRIMKERTEKIEKGIKDAKENSEVLNNTKIEYENVINKAKNEAHLMFQEGKKEAENKKNQIIEEAKKEVSSIIENGKKTLENEKIKMMSETKGEIVSLAIKITEKIIGAKMDGTYDEKTINELNNL